MGHKEDPKRDVLIVFTMYGYCEELQAYEICRFMLDECYQGKGDGTCALHIIIAEMIRCYQCDEIYLSTSPANFRGRHIYERPALPPPGKLAARVRI